MSEPTMKDRVVALERHKGADLLENPKNWRTHPDGQRKALEGVMAQVGVSGALIAYRHPVDGLTLIDGHLRAHQYPEQEWPVVVVDVTPEEADILLATVDPMAELAHTDGVMLANLLADIEADNSELKGMIRDLAEREGIELGDGDGDGEGDGDGDGEGEEGGGNRRGGLGNPIAQYALVFENEEQQAKWYAFLRGLKEKEPGHETVAGRLMAWIERQDG